MLIKVSCILALVALVSSEHAHSSQYVHSHIKHEPTVYIYEPKHEAGHRHHELQEHHQAEAKSHQEVPKYYYVESSNHLGGKTEETKKPNVDSEHQHKEKKHEPAYSSQYFHRHDGHALPVYIHKHEDGHMKPEQHQEEAKSYHHEESSHKHEESKHHHEEQKNEHETKEQQHGYIVQYFVPKYEYEHKAEGSHAIQHKQEQHNHKQEHESHGGHTIKTDYSVHVQHVVPEKHHESHEKKHHR